MYKTNRFIIELHSDCIQQFYELCVVVGLIVVIVGDRVIVDELIVLAIDGVVIAWLLVTTL